MDKSISRFTAVIPARGGSKGIPGKNIRELCGRPLIYWCIKAANECAEISDVYVASDDAEIRSIVNGFGFSKTRVVERSPETASDTASTESFLMEFAQAVCVQRICLIQATSPLITAEDISGGVECMKRANADSVLSVVPQKRFLWEMDGAGFGAPKNYDILNRPRRQEFEGHYVENGAFYLFSREGLLKTGSRLHGKVGLYSMSEASYFELDDLAEWEIVETILLRRERNIDNQRLKDKITKIKLVFSDLDGVFTDAGMYYSERGDELKKFNTRDGMGVSQLRAAGFGVGIITSEETELVVRRAKKLGVDFLVQGALDKAAELRKILEATDMTMDEVAFIGDDVNDLPVLRTVGFAVCPEDACSVVGDIVHYKCRLGGGEGCFRELADLLLRNRS